MSEGRARKRRKTPPLSVSWLWSEATRHLQRWPASERRIRRLLWKRVGRAQGFHGGTKADAALLVEGAMAKLISTRMVDDDRFSRLWVVSLRRRGTSARMIQQKLRDKGVDGHHIEAALAAYVDDEGGDAEHCSAEAYAKRRRLGHHRNPYDDSRERRSKDLAAMGRAGFSYGVAQEVLSGASEDH